MATTGEPDNLGMVRQAIARNAVIVLSLPEGGRLRHHKSRFLADAGDGFWVASVPEEAELIEEVIASGRPAGVSFRSGEAKVMFAAEIQHFLPGFRPASAADGAGGGAVPALLLRFPSDVRTVQRRKSFRVPIMSGASDLQVKLWTLSERSALRDKPVASREILCEPRDISLGGIGLTIHASGSKAHSLDAGGRVRVQLALRDTVVVLEGRLRYAPRATKDATLRVGVQFGALGDGREDRLAALQLEKIVNEVQRELIRRKKLNLPVPAA